MNPKKLVTAGIIIAILGGLLYFGGAFTSLSVIDSGETLTDMYAIPGDETRLMGYFESGIKGHDETDTPIDGIYIDEVGYYFSTFIPGSGTSEIHGDIYLRWYVNGVEQNPSNPAHIFVISRDGSDAQPVTHSQATQDGFTYSLMQESEYYITGDIVKATLVFTGTLEEEETRQDFSFSNVVLCSIEKTITMYVPPANEDTDSDGLLDSWEMQYFSDLDETATGDPDGDGLTNLQEYQNGTDPTVNNNPGNGNTWVITVRETSYSGDIIGGATVTVNGVSQITGADGKTTFTGLPTGLNTATVSAAGYATTTITTTFASPTGVNEDTAVLIPTNGPGPDDDGYVWSTLGYAAVLLGIIGAVMVYALAPIPPKMKAFIAIALALGGLVVAHLINTGVITL